MTSFVDPSSFSPPTSEGEFNALMERLDEWLQAKGLIAAARQLAAVAELSFAAGLNGRIPRQRDPHPGVYTGEDLVLRGADWYDKRYSDALNVIRGPGRIIVEIRSDLFGLRFPFVTGTAYIRCSLEGYPKRGDGFVSRASDGLPDINVLDYIEGLPAELARVLRNDEAEYLVRMFVEYHPKLMKMRLLQSNTLASAALADADMAVHSLLSHPPHFGAARWAALQTAEKMLKSFVATKQGNHPWGHDLARVARAAEEAGLATIPRHLIDAVQCEAGVRYGNPSVNRDEAVQALYRALQISEIAADGLHASRRAS